MHVHRMDLQHLFLTASYPLIKFLNYCFVKDDTQSNKNKGNLKIRTFNTSAAHADDVAALKLKFSPEFQR